jgi:glycosyltransferase involved in cell wall biosynthesis
MARIGYYLSSKAIGGLERHVLTLIDRLADSHHVEIFCDGGAGAEAFCAEIRSRGLHPRLLPAHGGSTRGVLRPIAASIPVMLEARRVFSEAKLDVIHFHAGQLGLMYAPTVASCALGIRTRILTLHNPILEHRGLRRSIESRVLARLSRIVAVSDYTKRELVDKKGVAPERVSVISNGVDVETFENALARAEAQRALDLPNDGLVVGFAGRLHHLKGVDLLIEAVPLVKRRFPGVRFVIVGEGEEDETLKQQARERGVSDVILFAGYRRDAWRLMPAFDVVALPSRDEAQSIALLEAMACRRPVVAARVGGVPEVVADGVTGLLFARENVGALAGALIELLSDGEKRESMGEAGRRRVGERFSQAEMLRRTMSLYENGGATPQLRPEPG